VEREEQKEKPSEMPSGFRMLPHLKPAAGLARVVTAWQSPFFGREKSGGNRSLFSLEWD
jgi:hypothetical protein